MDAGAECAGGGGVGDQRVLGFEHNREREYRRGDGDDDGGVLPCSVDFCTGARVDRKTVGAGTATTAVRGGDAAGAFEPA